MQINRESQEFYFVFFSFICKLTVNWQRLNTREIDILAFNIDRWTRSNWSVLSLMHFVCKQPITFCVSGTASLRSNRMFGYSYGVRTPSYHPLNWQSKPLLGYVIPPNKSGIRIPPTIDSFYKSFCLFPNFMEKSTEEPRLTFSKSLLEVLSSVDQTWWRSELQWY